MEGGGINDELEAASGCPREREKGAEGLARDVVACPCARQPKERKRAKPSSKGGGRYFHIEVRPKSGFKIFRTQDVGAPGGIERVAGKRESGSWSTLKWLISKD
jgi:hypothetical protein